MEIASDRRPSLLNAYLIDAMGIAFAVLYALLKKDAPTQVELFIRFAPTVATCNWFRRYLHHVKMELPYDSGFFLGMAWPVLIPVYAWRAKGWRGWRLVVFLFGLIVAPDFFAVLVRAFANAGG